MTGSYVMTKKILLPFIFILLVVHLQTNNTFAQSYVVGGDYDYAPITFVDENGNASGLDIDILKTISRKRNIKFSYQLSSWDSALHHIQSGEIDIITGIIFSQEREKFVDFTIPIHTEYYSIFIRDDLEFQDISSLYNYKPIVLDQDISIEKYLIPMGLYKNYVMANSLPEALKEIELGNADYVIAPNSLGINEINRNKYQHIDIKGPPIIPSIYCMAVKKGDSQLLNILNEEITELRKSGTLTEIQNKWEVHERDEYKYERIAKSIAIFLGASIFLLLLFLVWIRTLRAQIRKKTKSIEQNIQELQKSEIQLKELNATKDKLFSIIGHDLRAPFNAIIGFSELLTEAVKEKEMKKIEKYSDIISNSSQKAMDLLLNLMEWSSSQTGRMSFTPENFDMNQIIHDNIHFYKEIAKDKSISITNKNGASRNVYADKAMINTVLRNLISNAIKFTNPGGHIEIAAERIEDGMKVSVSDTGTGMSKAEADKLFGSKTQHSTPGTKNEGGTGLGLMLCKEFIEKHQGKIWAESEPGKGSVFYFTLPCRSD